jgi:eukaryotic-like serine/threonine-protein kinase
MAVRGVVTNETTEGFRRTAGREQSTRVSTGMSNDPKTATSDRIGRYHITGEIGRGGMGVVYRGEDKLIGREVAIKTLTEATPELRERFYVEAKSGILSHPNIVTVYELGEHEGNPFIAMEFLPGESLEKILRQRGRLPVPDSISIVEQICAGLGYAHAHGLLHRDVKPANVIVLPDGRVKIVDFGIARLADRDTRLTKTDALLGTFHYIAPERLKGEVSDGRADIWSAGIMLYEMISGELPFRGKDVSALYRVIHDPYPPITQMVEDAPEELKAVLDKALAKEAKDRYATAEEMAFDLQALGGSLKRVRLDQLLDTARRLSGEQEFASARTVLLQAQRIDPANTAVRMLMQEVQEQLNQLQRSEQIRQLIGQGETAFAAGQFDDAITFYSQAADLDTENQHSLSDHVRAAQAGKALAQRVGSLWEQANEARGRGDLTRARQFLEQALEINQQSTDLRNAHAIVLREIRRREQERTIEDLLQAARDNYGAQKYTEAMSRLREAAEIDPTHGEVQELLISVTARQKEERRRALLEQILAEIQESLDAERFEQAQDRVSRALDTLPAEATLLRVKREIEERKRGFETEQLVHAASLRAQQALEDPRQALAILEEALEQAPGDRSLLEFRSRLEEQIERARKEDLRVQRLKRAQGDLHAARYEEAIRGLESLLIEEGSSEDAKALLELTRREQALDAERRQQDAIQEAVKRCEDHLAAGKLNTCLDGFAVAARTYGESSALTQAREQCEQTRQSAADAMLRETLRLARERLQQGKRRQALKELTRNRQATSFASEAVRAEYEQLKAQIRSRPDRRMTGAMAAATNPRLRVWFVGSLALLLAAALATGVWHGRRHATPSAASLPHRPAPAAAPAAISTDYMDINASPWATVAGIRTAAGKDVDLKSGNRATPLRVDGIAAGDYEVTLQGPDHEQQVIHCHIGASQHLCTAEMGNTNPDELLRQALAGGGS